MADKPSASSSSAKISPGCTGGNPLLTFIPNSPLLIVHYLYIMGPAILPAETDALLGIDADIVLVRPASGRDPSTQGFVE